jgi:hypothetical protein
VGRHPHPDCLPRILGTCISATLIEFILLLAKRLEFAMSLLPLCIGEGSAGAAGAQGAGAAAGDRPRAAGAEAGSGDAAMHAGAGTGAGAHPGAPRAHVHRGPGRAEAARGAPHPDGHPQGSRGHHPL